MFVEYVNYHSTFNILGAIHMKDFRPVALTFVVAKCMERIVCIQLEFFS